MREVLVAKTEFEDDVRHLRQSALDVLERSGVWEGRIMTIGSVSENW